MKSFVMSEGERYCLLVDKLSWIAESFFSNLKKEKIKNRIYNTREEAKSDVFEYIEMFYNRKCRHDYLNQMSPMVFEALQTASI